MDKTSAKSTLIKFDKEMKIEREVQHDAISQEIKPKGSKNLLDLDSIFTASSDTPKENNPNPNNNAFDSIFSNINLSPTNKNQGNTQGNSPGGVNTMDIFNQISSVITLN